MAYIPVEPGAFYRINVGLHRARGAYEDPPPPPPPPFNLLPHGNGGGPIVGGQVLRMIYSGNGEATYIFGSLLISGPGGTYAPYHDQNLQLDVPSIWGRGRYGGRYYFTRIPNEQIPDGVTTARNARNQALRNVYEHQTMESAGPGHGPANLIRRFAGIRGPPNARRSTRKSTRRSTRRRKNRRN